VSRVSRSTELRALRVELDEAAERVVEQAARSPQPVRFIANQLDAGDDEEYQEKALEVRVDNHLREGDTASFLEVAITDATHFASTVHVTAVDVGVHQVLRASGPSVPNVLAAVLLALRVRLPEPP